MKKERLYQVLLIIALTPVIAVAMYFGYRMYNTGVERSELKKDYSELNNIKYGLLSVDAWRIHMTEIVSEQIDAFDLTQTQEDTLRAALNKVLNSVITRANEMVNKKQTKLDKKIKQFAIKQLVDVDRVRAKVPEFSQSIIDELKKPTSKERIKYLARTKFEEFAEKTHDSISNESAMNAILAKYDAKNIAEFNLITALRVRQLQEWGYNYTFGMVACLLLFLILWLILRNRTALHTPFFVMSVLLALIVLLMGLISPMIEIDARIKELNFLLIGKPLIFTDQVIFYQSKSILDVVHILLTNGKADSMLVGALILIFSVIFPITKLICTKIYLLGGEKLRQNKFLNWFAFKSGKWSMADVMVVAIFMAYIGFKGILDTQLEPLNVKNNSLATIATNETSLQPGMILFVSYVMFGLILGALLKKITFNEKLIDISKFRIIGRSKRGTVVEIPKTELPNPEPPKKED